jgi:uncharacterized protein (TIGR03382 family)
MRQTAHPLVRSGLAGLLVVAGMAAAWPARAADQLVAFDEEFTILAQGDGGLEPFHHRIDSKPSEPASWVAPVDYAHGTAHIHLEILKKPSERNTKILVCFDGEKEAYGCLTIKSYTTQGTIIDQPIEMKEGPVWQWSKIKWGSRRGQYHIVVKDAGSDIPGGKPATDFAPTTVRLVMTMVAPGGTYAPPAGGGGSQDGGVPAADAGAAADSGADVTGSGGASGSTGGASGMGSGGASGGSAGSNSGGASGGSAGSSSGGASGGSAGSSGSASGGSSGGAKGGSSGGSNSGGSPSSPASDGGSSSSGCSAGGPNSPGGSAIMVLLLAAAAWIRSRRARIDART